MHPSAFHHALIRRAAEAQLRYLSDGRGYRRLGDLAAGETARYVSTGATVGSAIPVVGTAVGAVVGGVVGGVKKLLGRKKRKKRRRAAAAAQAAEAAALTQQQAVLTTSKTPEPIPAVLAPLVTPLMAPPLMYAGGGGVQRAETGPAFEAGARPAKDNTVWYVAGGGALLLIILLATQRRGR